MYYPYQKGRYEVSPGLLPFGKDFGNGIKDQKLFQIDADFSHFRNQLRVNRDHEAASKYVCFAKGADQRAIGEISAFIAQKLAQEYPEQITFAESEGYVVIASQLTAERAKLDPQSNGVRESNSSIAYENAWDAVGAQVQEDMAIWKLNPDGSEEIEALHLNAPNHWAAESKVGRSFAAVHSPVAHIEKITPWAVRILQGIIEKGPYVRFAWGIGTDHRLNHHPEPAPGMGVDEWNGRRFSPAKPELFVRVERQVLWGFPNLQRALFTIRTYFHDVSLLADDHPEALKGLIDAISSMSIESLEYKGLAQDKVPILEWLNQLLNQLSKKNAK